MPRPETTLEPPLWWFKCFDVNFRGCSKRSLQKLFSQVFAIHLPLLLRDWIAGHQETLYYTSCFNHSFSFSSAFPRCEIWFFFSLAISAYVSPSYSKHASQPGITESVAPKTCWTHSEAHQNVSVLLLAQSYPAHPSALPTTATRTTSDSRPSGPEISTLHSPDPRNTQKYISLVQIYRRNQRGVYRVVLRPKL